MNAEDKKHHLLKEIADRLDEYRAGLLAVAQGAGSDVWRATENKRLQIKKLEAEMDALCADQRPT